MKKRKNLTTWWTISVFLLALGIGTSSVFATGTYNGGNGLDVGVRHHVGFCALGGKLF